MRGGFEPGAGGLMREGGVGGGNASRAVWGEGKMRCGMGFVLLGGGVVNIFV